MLDKLAAVVVEKRRLILGVALSVTLACGVLALLVDINKDMTKYLSPGSSMKQGIDIMNAEFPEQAVESTIRVMATGLTPAEIDDLYARLDSIEHVSDIAYHKDDPAYNIDNHTLFVLAIPYDYKTPEELSVEAALDAGLEPYTFEWHNDDTSPPGLALKVIIVAVLLVLLVLFIMCPSWVEPLLFLGVIGIAVIINMGTNIVLGSISSITFQMSAILQLALSMDYSVILMSRYRKERATHDSSEAAMRAAFSGAFSSVSASSLTTVVGLLMLCFMSYRIGMDLGLVLAKGVFISMICVLLVLPGVILMAERLIERSTKPALRVGMDWAAKYSYRVRVPVTVALVILFAVSYVLQVRTNIDYTLAEDDKVAEFFPADNSIVMVYDNADEARMAALADELAGDARVKSVVGYSTVLGKPLTVPQLHKQLSSMGGDTGLSQGVLTMLYWAKYQGMDTAPLPAGEFLTFLAEVLTTDETFAANVPPAADADIARLGTFGDAEALTVPRSAADLADVLGMSKDDVLGLMVLYFSEHAGAAVSTMTLPTFVHFVLYEVAADPAYAGMFDAASLAELRRMGVFVNREAVTQPRSYADTAAVLGMQPELMKLLYAYRFAQDPAYDPGAVTVEEMTAFVRNDLLSDGVLAQFLTPEQADALQALVLALTLPDMDEPLTAAQMADALGMDASRVLAVYERKFGADAATAKMSVDEFLTFVLDEGLDDLPEGSPIADIINAETLAELRALRERLTESEQATGFTAADLVGALGVDAQTAKLIVCMAAADRNAGVWKLSLEDVIAFLAHDEFAASLTSAEERAQLQMLNTVIADSLNGVRYTPERLSGLLGMPRAQARQLFLAYTLAHGNTSTWQVSVQDFLAFLANDVLENPSYAALVDATQADALKAAHALVDAVVTGEHCSAARMADLLAGLGGATGVVGVAGATGATEAAGEANEAGTAGEPPAPSTAPSTPAFAIDANTVELLYLYKHAADGADPTWRMSVEELYAFLMDSIVTNPRFAALLTDDARAALADGQTQLADGKGQLVTPHHSRLIITSSLPEESAETDAFIERLTAYADNNCTGETHLIGSSVMVYEMKQVFDREFFIITLLTAASIFLIVALTFRSLIIPLALVLLVQTGVNITASIIGATTGGMYYLALLIVECILMGSTIDYGILFTSCYREARATCDIPESLRRSYAQSIGTIMTSGLIVVPVVGVLQYLFEEPAIRSIVQTLSMGGASVILMILFVLPGVLAALDKFVTKRQKSVQADAPTV